MLVKPDAALGGAGGNVVLDAIPFEHRHAAVGPLDR